jgi:hypothetical protein
VVVVISNSWSGANGKEVGEGPGDGGEPAEPSRVVYIGASYLHKSNNALQDGFIIITSYLGFVGNIVG